ncbi:hypothetical protein GDO81_028506 [Engystomops pustulosus]|uniref:Uncharacterized protein n=1 Tax=Engystomops pustulosus TaxID=76066 RepID=A0AAV6YN78_ENGPU|nr:hypothetical protein GDO81_028506 [Engystomops pustulosus]
MTLRKSVGNFKGKSSSSKGKDPRRVRYINRNLDGCGEPQYIGGPVPAAGMCCHIRDTCPVSYVVAHVSYLCRYTSLVINAALSVDD